MKASKAENYQHWVKTIKPKKTPKAIKRWRQLTKEED